MPDEPALPPEAALIKAAQAAAYGGKGMSGRETARRAGISEGTLRRIVSPRKIDRPAETVAKVAAALAITPDELREAGRFDAAGALQQMMTAAAAEPDVAAAADGEEDAGWAPLMSEILAGLAAIEGEPGLSTADRRQLREAFLAGLQRDAAERRRSLRVVRRLTGHS
ncbi:MAG TPA: helix-turn-helix transcriptional regulator [Streptosporangiaceae bacterium]|jgi:transcriptional regulator with XRE-family HTH domain